MRRPRIWATSIAATLSLCSVAVSMPAHAASGGGCPTSFTQASSLKEMVKIQKSYGNKSATTDALVSIDKNGDGSLCWMVLPQGANDPYVPLNVIDNNA